MKRSTKTLYYILMLIIAIVVTRYTLSYFVTRPGSILIDIGGDSMKNYYSFLYHSMFGDGFWFMGMNYPLGENIIYADGQPLLSILLQKVGITSLSQALAVLHLAIVAGFFLCIVYCYKILCYNKVHPMVAIIGACLITIMSPQIFRVMGHFGLSYMCIVPMLYYWTIKYHDSKRIIYILLLVIVGCIFSLLHPYMGAVTSIWVLCYIFSYFIAQKVSLKSKLKHITPLVIAVGFIALFVKSVLVLTDPVTDRSTNPLGVFDNYITYKSVLISNISSLWQFILNGKAYETGDGGYLGIVGSILFLLGITVLMVRKVRGQKATLLQYDPIWILVAVFALIFSFGIPLVWMKSAFDHIAALRQFRTLGRFVWMFYYVASIYGVIVLYRCFLFLKAKGSLAKGITLLVVSFGIWGFEAKGYIDFYHKQLAPAMYNYDVIFNRIKIEQDWDEFLIEHGYRPDDLQAILGLPYYHIGSEKLWLLKDNAWMSTISMKAALQLYLPIMNVNMSRTSWSQTFKQAKILSGLYSDKSIIDSLPNNKPILVLSQPNIPTDPDVRLLLDIADSLGSFGGDLSVFALDPLKLKRVCDSAVANALLIAENATITDTCINGKPNAYVVDHFDNIYTDNGLAGSGAWPVDSQLSNEILRLYNFSIDSTDTTEQVYELSIWAKVNTYDHRSPEIKADILDADSNYIETIYLRGTESTDMMGGLWLRISTYFTMPKNAGGISIYMREDQKENYFFLDELLLRPASSLIISKLQQKDSITILANNHIINSRKL